MMMDILMKQREETERRAHQARARPEYQKSIVYECLAVKVA